MGWNRSLFMMLGILAWVGVAFADTSTTSLEGLAEGSQVEGFTAVCRYTLPDGSVVGARFAHPSGMLVDVLRLETVPQLYMAVNTVPNSNRGEPDDVCFQTDAQHRTSTCQRTQSANQKERLLVGQALCEQAMMNVTTIRGVHATAREFAAHNGRRRVNERNGEHRQWRSDGSQRRVLNFTEQRQRAK